MTRRFRLPFDKKKSVTHKQQKKMAHTYELIEAKIYMEVRK